MSGGVQAAGAERDGARALSRGGALDYLRAVAIIGAATALAVATKALLDVPDVEMMFLLGVMIAAATTGRRAALLAAALAVAAYDFFCVPPRYTLDVADGRYLLTFVMMFGVSVVISTLTLRLREERQAAVAGERRTSALLALSRDLGAALDAHGVAEVCARRASEALGAPAVFLRSRTDEELQPLAAHPARTVLVAQEL